MDITLDSEELRFIIKNAAMIKKECKCTVCNGTGWVNWNAETGSEIKAGENYDDPERDNAECETCEGVGYIW